MKSIITVVAALIVATRGQDEACPRGAEFVISFDNVIDIADNIQNMPDPNLTFFRDVLQFTEQEIETATQSAIQYYNTTFGLDFSESVPNEQGERVSQNSSFSALKLPITATATANRWLVNGNTKSRCFDARLGFFRVTFTENQVLYGTFGGTEGRTVPPSMTSSDSWGYAWINSCPQSPVVIQVQATAPRAYTPEGLEHQVYALSHRGLGDGVGLQTLYINPLPPDQRFGRLTLYFTMTFPANQFP